MRFRAQVFWCLSTQIYVAFWHWQCWILLCPPRLLPVYHKQGYIDIVARAAEHSMQAAVQEVQAHVEYPEKGEVSI